MPLTFHSEKKEATWELVFHRLSLASSCVAKTPEIHDHEKVLPTL